MNLKPETLQRIDEVIAHYPVKRSAALRCCTSYRRSRATSRPAAIEWIAQKLGLQPINIYELVTFYPMFRQQRSAAATSRSAARFPVHWRAATGRARSSKSNSNARRGEISADGEVTIEFVECLASCGSGPAVMIDDDLHEKVDCARARELAAQIKKEGLNAEELKG